MFDGVYPWAPDSGLVEFRIVDVDEGYITSIFNPTHAEIIEAARKHEFNYEVVTRVLDDLDSGTHTLVIDAKTFRAAYPSPTRIVFNEN
jgi:hypothetical protein